MCVSIREDTHRYYDERENCRRRNHKVLMKQHGVIRDIRPRRYYMGHVGNFDNSVITCNVPSRSRPATLNREGRLYYKGMRYSIYETDVVCIFDRRVFDSSELGKIDMCKRETIKRRTSILFLSLSLA